MAVVFSTKQFDTHLYVTVCGTIQNVDDVISYWTPVRKQAVESGLRKILVDYSEVELTLDYFGMIQVSNYALEKRFPFHHLKIAFLVQPHLLKKLIEYKTPAKNRGFDFEPFTDLDTALDWLLKQ